MGVSVSHIALAKDSQTEMRNSKCLQTAANKGFRKEEV